MLVGGGTAPPEGASVRHLADGRVELRLDVAPAWAFRLRGGDSGDGLLRRRGAGLQRLVHVGAEPVLVGVVQPAPDRVTFGARAGSIGAAAIGIARLRFALGVDDDLAPFHAEFRDDPVIGRAVRSRPALRVMRRPDPWEALYAAICEQLIEVERALAIQRRMIARWGLRCPETGLRDAPTPAAIAGAAPAELESFDLAARRCRTLRQAAGEVAGGRIDLTHPDHEAGWRRLRAIPGVGAWTVEMLALRGQGRYDQVPAMDLGYVKLIGRLTTGNPKARADEPEIRGFFERYGAWKGLAGAYLRIAAARGRLAPLTATARAPSRAGTRSSAPGWRSAGA